MTRKELKKKSTILLASLAFSDLLVGAVSMPVTITLDSRALQKRFAENSFCAIDIVNDFFMYATFGASFFHLLVIAWERYVAVHKWNEYKVIVTISRIRKYVALAWVVALLTVVPKVAVAAVPARCELMFVADILISTVYFICLLLIGYFYVMVYRGVRRWNRSPFRQVDALIKSKLETKAAFATFCITVFAAASLVPSFAVLVLGRTVAPFLRMSSYFRWAGIFLQLNSLINSVLYCYRDRRFKRGGLELLRIKKPPTMRARHRDFAASLDFGELDDHPQLVRSQSCGAVMCENTILDARDVDRKQYGDSVVSLEVGGLLQRPHLTKSKSCGTVMCQDPTRTSHVPEVETPMSSSSSDDETEGPTKLTVTVQIETAARMKAIGGHAELRPKDTNEFPRSRRRHGKMQRSTSVDGTTFSPNQPSSRQTVRNYRLRSASDAVVSYAAVLSEVKQRGATTLKTAV